MQRAVASRVDSMIRFARPGDFPVKPQEKKNRGAKRSSAGIKLTEQYGTDRHCEVCDRKIQRYNPDTVCDPCQLSASATMHRADHGIIA